MKRPRWPEGANRLPFPLVLALRSLAHGRFAPALACALCVAGAVALAMSAEMSSRAVHAGARETARALLGDADFSVGSAEARLPEALLEEVRALPGVAWASPRIGRTFRVGDGARRGEALHVVGIDLAQPGLARRAGGDLHYSDGIRLLALPDSIIVAKPLARRLDVHDGEALTLVASGLSTRVVVRGQVGGELGRAFDGQVAAMDVYALQDLVGMRAHFEHIDVGLAPDSDAAAVQAGLERLAAGRARVARAGVVDSYGRAVLGALELAVWAVTAIAVCAAAFLTWAVLSLSIANRVEELSLLRAAGLEARRAGRLVALDALLIAAVGIAVGSMVALPAAHALFALFTRASERLAGVGPGSLEPTALTFAVGCAVGLAPALAAALPAARRARRLDPLQLLDGYRGPGEPGRAARPVAGWVGAGLLLATCVAALAGTGLAGRAGLGAVLGLGVAAIALGAAPWVQRALPALARSVARLVPGVGWLVAPALAWRSRETGASVAVWAVGIAAWVALVGTVTSVARSIDASVVGVFGDQHIMVFAEDPLESGSHALLRPETLDALRARPGVEAVGEYYFRVIDFRGESVDLGTLSSAVLAEAGGLRGASRDPDATRDALLRGELVMSPAFARRFDVAPGDEIVLDTRGGPHAFRVGGLLHDHAGPAGSLHLDVETFDRHFERPGAWQALVVSGRAPEALLPELRRASLGQALFYRAGAERERHTQRVVGRFADLLALPLALFAAIGIVALLNLLHASGLEQRRERALLRAAGATRGDVLRLAAASSAAIALLGSLGGLALSRVWTEAVCAALSQQLGWIVQARLDLERAVLLVVGAVALAVVASLWPALRASRERLGASPGL